MMYWNGDWSWGAWLAMTAMMVTFWVAVAWIVVAVIRSGQAAERASNAESLLAERLARGEINADEYTRLRDTIRS